MRLTLRTLLAYLDDVLDPADKEELAKKINSSEFAEDLVHRTKDTMRRLRLSAPQVVGTGMGLDPNSVAEYLDNVMPPERVGDFERICLESDMHLAEVASCHHVLTMVLGQPADIDPAAKQRMYSIPAEAAERKQHRVERAHTVAAGQAIVAPPPVDSGLAAHPVRTVAPVHHAEIPEYLRASGWARYRNLLLGLAAVLLVGFATYLFGSRNGWFGGTEDLVALAPAENEASEPPARMELPPAALTEVTPPAEPAHDVASAAEGPVMSAPEPNHAEPVATAPAPAIGGEDVARVDAATAPQVIPPAPVAQETPMATENPTDTTAAASPDMLPPAVIPAEQTAASAVPSAAIPPNPTVPPTSTTLPSTTTAPAVASPAEVVSVEPDGTVRVGENVAGASDAAGPADGTVAPSPPVVVELGTYRGGKTVLLRHDDAAGAWLRMAPRSAVVSGQKLLALPEFRPIVSLVNGIHMDLAGGTVVTLGAANDAAAGAAIAPTHAGLPTIDLMYGRIVLINTSNDEQPVHLVLGSTLADARLAHNATLAIEVERKYVPGSDPRKTPAPVIARLYVPDGGVTWQDAHGTATVDKASEWTIADGVATALVASSSPPTWIDQETTPQSSEQRFAAPVIDAALASNRPADVQLLELFQGNGRREVKSLVARSGMHVGLFVPFIEALRDSGQRPNWTAHIQSLRAAMALGPESSEKIWQALVEQRGNSAAADLYEMLCGYNTEQIGQTPDQLKTGAIARLIDWLDKESLDYRVLAVHDLWEITGKQLMPNPTANAAERARNIKAWRMRLDGGQLTPVAADGDRS